MEQTFAVMFTFWKKTFNFVCSPVQDVRLAWAKFGIGNGNTWISSILEFFCKLKVLNMLLENRKTPCTLILQFVPNFELITSFSDQSSEVFFCEKWVYEYHFKLFNPFLPIFYSYRRMASRSGTALPFESLLSIS